MGRTTSTRRPEDTCALGAENPHLRRFTGEWKTRRIGDFAGCTAGGTPSTLVAEYWGGPIRWMNSGELHKKFIRDVEGRITERGLRESSAKLLPTRCVLIGLAGQGKTRGTVAINLVELCTNQSIAAIYPNESFNSEYLFHNLHARYDEIRGLSSGGGGRGGLNLQIIQSITLPFPEMSEQQAIAAVLSDVDSLFDALAALIAKKRAIKQTTMQQLLSGKTRLPGCGGEWEAVEVGSIGSLYGGLTGKVKGDFGRGSTRYVTFLSILENTILNAKHTDFVHVAPSESQNAVRQGDILFNGTSETPDDLAMGAVVGVQIEHLYLNSFCFGLRIRDQRQHDPLFLAYLFRSPTGRTTLKALAQGATRYNLSKSQFLKLNLSVPTLSEQQAIAQVLSDMDAEIAALERRRDKVRDIKQGMLQQLLSGRVRLVKPE